ncbi:MAG: transcription elongation protein SprT [Janthinobacterium lividum]
MTAKRQPKPRRGSPARKPARATGRALVPITGRALVPATGRDLVPAPAPAPRATAALPPPGIEAAQFSHAFREGWLASATDLLRPLFASAGEPLKGAGRAAIGFTSHGRKSNVIGECWNSIASADAHFEIFIAPHIADPVEVLGILAHELCHAALPLGTGHGPRFRKLALAIGLTGKMTATVPGEALTTALKRVADELGPLPHGSLGGGRFGGGGGTGGEMFPTAPRKKQKVNMLKAYCGDCDYVVRLTATHARKGAPLCGVHHSAMTVEWGDDG